MKHKNVFFLSNIFPDDQSRGITKKVLGQIKGIEENGYQVDYYTGYTKKGAAVFDRSGRVVFEKKHITRSGILKRITRNQLLKKAANDFIKLNKEKFDIFYGRYLFSDPAFISLLRTAKENSTYVLIEAHSYPLYIKSCPQLYPVYLVDILWNKYVKKYADYIVSVASGYSKIWGVKVIQIENGIDTDSIIVKKQTESDTIRLVAVAYEWAPHGYDRIIKGLKEYYDGNWTIRVELKLVGTIMKSTRKLIDNCNLHEYVTFVGKKHGRDLDKIYDNSDIGVGSLAIYRAGVKESANELKTREYISRGLPYLCTGAVQDDEWFCCVFPPDDSPININTVVEFYKKIIKIDDYNIKISCHAKLLTWAEQFRKVFQVIENEESYN